MIGHVCVLKIIMTVEENMTVAQMEKEFIIKDGEQKHFMRLKINKEFSRQLIGHFLREVNQQMSLEEKTKEFHKGVQIVNNRFCNLYGKFAETSYEYNKTKEIYPEEWDKIPGIKAHMDSVMKDFPKDLFKRLLK